MEPAEVDRLMEKIRQILDAERELNAADEIIVSLITRIGNQIEKASAELNDG